MDDDKVEFDELCSRPAANDGDIDVARMNRDEVVVSEPTAVETLARIGVVAHSDGNATTGSTMEAGAGEWTEAMLRDLLSQTLNQRIRHLLGSGTGQDRSAVDFQAAREARVRTSTHLLFDAVRDGDSEAMISVMCDLTPAELRDAVSGAEHDLRSKGLTTVDVRLDEYGRIVLFDKEKNNGVALAPSGSYQRVSQFYDGSFRYGIEFLLDESSKESVDSLFSKIKMQIAS